MHNESTENRLKSLVTEKHLGQLDWWKAQTTILCYVLSLSMAKPIRIDVVKQMFHSSDLWPQTTSTCFTK